MYFWRPLGPKKELVDLSDTLVMGKGEKEKQRKRQTERKKKQTNKIDRRLKEKGITKVTLVSILSVAFKDDTYRV